jgi:hypothetical protein
MSQARTTELLEEQAPSQGGENPTFNVAQDYIGFHMNNSGDVSITQMDGTVIVLTVISGIDYNHKCKQFNSVGSTVANTDIIAFKKGQ